MRKFLLALGLLSGVIFIITRFTEVQILYDTLKKGNWGFILLALLVEAVWIVNIGLTYRSIYRVLGMAEGVMHMLVVGISSIFVTVVTPSAGMSAIAVFISDARRSGYSQARAMVAWALYLFFDYTSFLCVLVLGLAVLARRNDLHWAEILASCIILFGAVGLATLLYLGLQSGKVLGDVLAWLVKSVNKIFWPFIHRSYMQVDRAYSFASDAADGVSTLRQNPRGLIKPLFLALLSKTLLVIIFLLTFLAFQVPFSAGTIIAGFSIGYLFMIVSP
ncbi:MAG: flippase-like domain-containing protein, partial [Planctomycetes bacterium]|nr:flippase-like domain-containing protein [Planctomycetota bacterium]